VVVAYDLMVMWGGQEVQLCAMIPTLREIFADDAEEYGEAA
jgi:hypothetical protein